VPRKLALLGARKSLVAPALVAYYSAKRAMCPKESTVITVCSQCDNPETKCHCIKYCCFCQSQEHVRLCVDGMYYCPDCREACDVRLADTDDH
jgi:hypothetical protein